MQPQCDELQPGRVTRLSRRRGIGLICSLAAVIARPATHVSSIPPIHPVGDSAEIRTAICSGCRITLDSVTRFGGAGADIVFVPSASLAVTSKGEVIVGAIQTGGEVAKLSSGGRFDRMLSRTGSGPGQLPFVTHVAVGAGDTVFLFDGISRWMHRVTSAGTFIDRTLLPGGIYNVLPIGGRRLFTSANVPSRAAVGYPLHVLDTAGVVASFGDEVDIADPLAAGRMIRYLGRGRGETVWVAHRLSYRIESWTISGRLTGVLTRTVDWFPPSETPPRTSPQLQPPQPTLRGVHDAGDGYLWVYVGVADPAWRAEPLRVTAVPGMFAPNYVLDAFVDTIIEVIELRRNVVVASYREGRALVPIGGGYLASYEEDDQGKPTYRIWQPRLSTLSH